MVAFLAPLLGAAAKAFVPAMASAVATGLAGRMFGGGGGGAAQGGGGLLPGMDGGLLSLMGGGATAPLVNSILGRDPRAVGPRPPPAAPSVPIIPFGNDPRIQEYMRRSGPGPSGPLSRFIPNQ